MKSAQPGTFERSYPRAFSRLRIVYFIVIAVLVVEIVVRIATYAAFRVSLAAHPEIERRLEQSRAFYPSMSVGVVTGEPAQWPAIIPADDGPPRVVPFGTLPADAFKTPLPSTPPPAGVVRIAFVGGSTTYDGYPERVGALLGERFGSEHIEVVNLGIPASNGGTSLLVMQRFLPQLRPQLIVVYHGFNDLVYARARAAAFDRVARGEAGPDDPALVVPPASRGLLSLLRGGTSASDQPIDAASLAALAANYEGMAALAHELDAALFVSTFAAPSYAALAADERDYFEAELRHLWPVLGSVDRYADDLARYHASVRELATRLGLGLIDVDAAVEGGRASFADNCHLTPEGREQHAEAVASALAPAIAALLESGS